MEYHEISAALQAIRHLPATRPENPRRLLQLLIQICHSKTVKARPRGTPVSFSRSTPDHSADFSPSELLARVASMQQQLVEAQVSSLRDR